MRKRLQRPRPARTDIRPFDRLQTAAETATLLTVELNGPVEGREDRAFRIIFQLMDDFRGSAGDVREQLVSDEPALTSEPRFDAFLAAVVEDMSLHASLPVPAWAARRDELLAGFWFPGRLKGLYAAAMVESPAAFRRRGIFIERRDLHRV